MKLNSKENIESFKWQDYYNTGIADVDLQHHKLVDLINEFGNALTKDTLEYKGIKIIFKKLVDYTLFHFVDEEEGMITAGIDERHIAFHKDEHALFINEVKSLYSDISQENLEGSRYLLEFLVNWLAFHILGIDQVMAQQIRDVKAGKTPAQAHEIDVSTNDKKTKALLYSLNTLFRQAGERNKELVSLNLSLEEKVNQRTQELLEANKHLELLSLTDNLTSLSNRRHAMILLKKQFTYAKNDNTSLSCLMIDADNFKEVNDTYGHDAGDKVLCLLSNILVDVFRTDDNICRLGGDEFLILCPKTTLEGAIIIAEKAREKINNLELDIWNSSISIGIASIANEMDDFMDLIKKADKALYSSKENGKNKVSY